MAILSVFFSIFDHSATGLSEKIRCYVFRLNVARFVIFRPGAHARAAGACTAAGFLREFVDFDSTPHWMHIDIAGVMGAAGAEVPYLPTKGMAGRPVRTLIGLVEAMAEEGEK